MALFHLVAGWVALTSNARRNMLVTIPITGRMAYHLFTIVTSKTDDILKLNRTAKWPSQHITQGGYGFFLAAHNLMIFLSRKLDYRS